MQNSRTSAGQIAIVSEQNLSNEYDLTVVIHQMFVLPLKLG